MSDTDLRTSVMAVIAPRLAAIGLNEEDLDDTTSLVDLGVVDSFSFLELASEIENRTGRTLDFAEADPEEFTTVGGLVRILQP